MDDAPAHLAVEVDERDDVVVVAVDGDVDASTCGQLGTVLRALAADDGDDDRRGLVLDLTRCGFMDSSGLSVLLNAQRRLTRAKRRFALACPPGTVRHLLALTALEGTFDLHDGRKAAVRAVSAR